MSIRVMSWVWDHGPSDRGELLVLLALADFADDDGNCWPAMVKVAEKARVCERGARKIIRRLEEIGLLKTVVGGGRHGCNQYRIAIENPERRSPTKPGTADRPGTVNPVPRSPRNAVPPEPENTKPGTGEQKTRNRGSAEPSGSIIDPSERRGRAGAREDAEIVATLSQVMPEDTALDYVAHRKAKRAKLTLRAATLVARSLDGHADPVAVVEASIANGWTGVFPDRWRPNGARAGPNGATNPEPDRVDPYDLLGVPRNA